jgi:tetratricopeptide (TPR) repeat protein
LRKVRRWEEVQTRSDTPEGVVQQFLLAFWGAEDPAKAVQLLSRHHQQDRFHEENIQEWKRVQRPLRSQMAKVGLDTDIVADMMVVMMQASVEGDDQVGYLVKHRLPNANITAIIVKEGGQYRILDVISGSSSSVGFAGYEVLARVEQGRLAEARRLLDWIRDEISPTGGDDPLAGPLFVRFWRKGEPGSAAAMRQAGCALLLGNKSTAGDAIRFLKSDLQNESDAAARGRLQLALAVAYGQVAQFGELVDIAISLYTRHPTSQIAFSMVCSALTNLGRWDELDRYIETRVQKDARDPDAIRARLLAAVWRGDLEVGRKQEDILRQSGKLEAGDLNNLAWLALVAGKVDERALQTIQEGILQSQSNPNAAFLHTAASIYAEVGKTAEAREVLLQSIDLRGIDEPDGDSWYVLGRIAEDYGEVKAARKMYGRVKKPENPRETLSSTFALAQRRIGQLKDTN